MATFKALGDQMQPVSDKIKDGAATMLSNMGDAWDRLQIAFGGGIARALVGPIASITAAVDDLDASGFFTSLGDMLAGMIGGALPPTRSRKASFIRGP